MGGIEDLVEALLLGLGELELLVELVEAEDGAKPLSDEELAEQLKKRDGISIARRTVTKYRKALGIPSSSQRKKF